MHTALLSLRLVCSNNNSGIYFHKPKSGNTSKVTSLPFTFYMRGKERAGLRASRMYNLPIVGRKFGNLPQNLDVSETNSDSSCEH
jgi:hypothetical protein